MTDSIKKEMQIAGHIKQIMNLLELENTEDNNNTPKRIAKMYMHELFRNRNNLNYKELVDSMTLFKAPPIHRKICVSEIPFAAPCSHHWMPMLGFVDVLYIPDTHIIGLSKIPRAVAYFSKRPQLQERFTEELGNFLVLIIHPKYLRVNVQNVNHTCVSARGIEKTCKTTTYFEYGEEK